MPRPLSRTSLQVALVSPWLLRQIEAEPQQWSPEAPTPLVTGNVERVVGLEARDRNSDHAPLSCLRNSFGIIWPIAAHPPGGRVTVKAFRCAAASHLGSRARQ